MLEINVNEFFFIEVIVNCVNDLSFLFINWIFIYDFGWVLKLFLLFKWKMGFIWYIKWNYGFMLNVNVYKN